MNSPVFELKKILPHVYHLHFEDPYQLAMHFLRAQEYYESPKFADQIFTLVDYMEWYAKEYGKGIFSYPQDWSGFNVPSWVLETLYRSHLRFADYSKYDAFMLQLVPDLMYKEGSSYARGGTGSPWYLIGTSSAGYKGDGDAAGVLDHELAHALYYTDSEYKQRVDQLLKNLNGGHPPAFHWEARVYPSPFVLARDILDKAGYHHRTIFDEIHAYASTGVHTLGLETVLTPELCAPFEQNFAQAKTAAFAAVSKVGETSGCHSLPV